MSEITEKSTIEDIAAIVSQKLSDAGIQAVLAGGAVVSIYTENEYESKDLDFITGTQNKKIGEVLKDIGFEKDGGRHFSHPKTEYFLEFPPTPLMIGDEHIQKWGQRKTEKGVIQMYTPTQSVMDRLAGYFHWNDMQNLEQAVMIAKHQKVNLSKIKEWSKSERAEDKYEIFLSELKKKKA